jgi:hypothetical protein
MKYSTQVIFGLLLLVVVPMELFCGFFAFRTLGEVTSIFYFLAIAMNLPLIAVAVKRPVMGAAGATVLALLVVPYQLYLGNRLFRVQSEATRIVAFAYSVKAEAGSFPSDLTAYAFRDEEMKQFIQQYSVFQGSREFQLVFRVGTTSTSHWFSSKDGWGYYPD